MSQTADLWMARAAPALSWTRPQADSGVAPHPRRWVTTIHKRYRMTRPVLLLLCTSGCWLAGCSSNVRLAPSAAPDAALTSIVRGFAASVNRLDLDSQLAHFTDEADFTFAEDGHLLPPKEQLRRQHAVIYRHFRDMNVSWDTIRTTVLSKTSGVVTAAGHWIATGTNGSSYSGTLAGTYVFVRRSGRWELVHGHASHGPPTAPK